MSEPFVPPPGSREPSPPSDGEERAPASRKPAGLPGTPEREIAELEDELRALPSRPMPPPASLPSGLRVSVASPCSESWDAMVGDERARHCSRCDRDVFNLGALRAEEIEALLAEHGVKRCVRFFRRADGTMLTADCPVNRPRRIALRVLAATAVAIGTATATAYYFREEPRGRIDGVHTMGDVVPRS